MPTDIEIYKIENGYLVEYERIVPELNIEEDVTVYFQTKDEAITFASNLLE